MKYAILLFLCVFFLTGCMSITKKTKPTETIVVEKIGQSSVVVETHGNLTRIYSAKNLEEK
jgi:uncharacterized protein YceK